MKQLIDQLWGEALDRAVPDTYSSLSWTQVEKIKQVFAELIVRECADLVKDFYQEDEFTCYSAKTEIKEHFGVEE